MSDPLLEKLSAADADLAAQEAKLAAELEAIQTKRASLQSVLNIFDSNQSTTTAIDSDINAAIPTSIEDMAVYSPIEPPSQPSKQKSKPQTKARSTRSRKATSAPTSTGRGWRDYLRDEYRQTPLPAVVAGVLQAHPNKVFAIADVVNTIFVNTIPQTARKGARERVSNILAEGARKDQWRRGETGCYFSK